jgi:general secretion pathway protein L
MTRQLGVDITPTAVRVALLNASYRKNTIEALREERLSDHATTSDAIRAATLGLKYDVVGSALAGARTFLRMLTLPATASKELAAVLPFEVEGTLPFELDEAVMDYRVLGRMPGQSADQIPIMAGVAYTEEVRDHIGLVLRGAGHEPQRVGIGPLPLANLGQIIPDLGRGLVAILDLGQKRADLLIIDGGEPRFARSTSQGVSGPDAGELIARELLQTVGAWRMQGGDKLASIYVVGSGRETPGLEAFVQAQLGVPMLDLPRPSVEGLSAEQLDKLPRFAKALGLAVGLGRRSSDLNMRRGALEAQQSFQFVRDKTPLLAGLAAAILVSFGFSIVAEMRSLDGERAQLEERLAATTQANFGERTTDPTRVDELLEAAIAGKTGDPMPTMDAFDVLVALSERVPKDMVHDIAEFDYNRGEVKMLGIVPNISDANLVKDKMAEHACFKDVNITRTTQLKNEGKQKYTLEFSVQCSADADKKKKTTKKPAPKPADKGGDK